MAVGQSTAHTWLVGAISRNARSTVRSHGPSRASKLRRVFCCLEHNTFEMPGASRNGRPGSRGSREHARAQKRGACRRERGASRIPMAERTEVRYGGATFSQSAATEFVLLFAASRGAVNAGGEDFGYFAPSAVKHPPSIDRTVESVRRDGCVAGSGEALWPNLRFGCRPPMSPVPQRAFPFAEAQPHACRHGGGEDVCYFGKSAVCLADGGRGFESRQQQCRSSVNALLERQQHRLVPRHSFTIRGEDRCYFVCGTRGRGFESRPAVHAPVAQR